MNKRWIVLPLLAGSVVAAGQTADEWLRQKRTQIKYYVEQVGALRIYTELGGKGYEIFGDGLRMIGDIKTGDFRLHNRYFESLSSVNPAVQQSAAARMVPIWNAYILQVATGATKDSFKRNVHRALLLENGRLFAEYKTLLQPGQHALNDAARLKRLNNITTQIQGQYQFIKSFVCENRVLDRQREHELHNLRTLRRAVAGDAAVNPQY